MLSIGLIQYMYIWNLTEIFSFLKLNVLLNFTQCSLSMGVVCQLEDLSCLVVQMNPVTTKTKVSVREIPVTVERKMRMKMKSGRN